MTDMEWILNEMVKWNFVVYKDYLADFKLYFEEMKKRNRILLVRDETGDLIAVLFFFLTSDYQSLYKKDLFATPDDEPTAHQVYVDKISAKFYNRELRNQIGDFFEAQFPQATELHYHRPPYDKHIIINRRKGAKICTK